ncbi:hypothetical protein PTKIN_Ptkin09bG0170300 [Pterospermum kingtungense]
MHNNRVALFDGIEEGGIRASSSYSHEIDEHNNERAMEGMQDRVSLLKRDSTKPPVATTIFFGANDATLLRRNGERQHVSIEEYKENLRKIVNHLQVYTLELEAEVAKLREMNQELQRKQEEMMEMQKNQGKLQPCFTSAQLFEDMIGGVLS